MPALLGGETVVAGFWTKERTEFAIAQWTAGKSYSDIASLLGVERGTVCSKLHREGETGKGGRRVMASKPKVSTPAQKADGIAALKRWQNEPGGVPLHEIPADGCHWPFADAFQVATRFCGCKKLSGLPYCGRHAAMAAKGYRQPAIAAAA